MKYVVQRRFQNELMGKVGGALDSIFEHIDGKTLHICESISVLEAKKKLTAKQKADLCNMLLNKAKEDGDTETLSFEVVPYSESVIAQANREA